MKCGSEIITHSGCCASSSGTNRGCPGCAPAANVQKGGLAAPEGGIQSAHPTNLTGKAAGQQGIGRSAVKASMDLARSTTYGAEEGIAVSTRPYTFLSGGNV